MSGGEFLHPDWWSGLTILVVLAWAAVVGAAVLGRRRLARLLGRPAVLSRRSLVLEAGLCLALGAIALALAGPLWARREVRVAPSGSDLVLLFDVSRSMDAEDNPPSRLERARHTAQGILERLSPGHRVALAAYADRGVLLTPLTPDSDAVASWVSAIDTDLIRPSGSNLADGLRAALEAFEEGSERPRVVLVLSDGEVRPALEDRDLGPLELALVRGLAVGVGSPLGATVPDGGVPLRDLRGEIVVSRRIVTSLEALTAQTDGRLWLADQWGDVDIDAVAAEIERDSRAAGVDSGAVPGVEPGGSVTRRVRAPMVTPFAALAFALLLLEAVAPTGGAGAVRTPGSNGRAAGARRPRLRIPGRPVVAAGLGALAVLIGLGAGGAGDPLARIDTLEQAANRRALRPWELIELGVARYEAGRRDEARHALGAAAHAALEANRSDQAAIAYHDLGVLDLDGDDLEAARDHFLEAVALAPGDHRSRFNLEWTLRALEQPEDEPPPSPTGEPPLDEDDPARTPERPETPEASPLPAPGKRLPPQPTPAERSTADSETSPGNAAGGVIDDPARAMLDVERAERWLARVSDDTGRALRSAAEPDGRPRAARDRGPAW